MSYHLTILRSTAGTQTLIPIDEVETAAEALGWTMTGEPPMLWKESDDLQPVLLHYTDGELWTDDPQPQAIEQMLHLADALDARVRGDDFETYRTAVETYDHPDDRLLGDLAETRSQELLKADLRFEKMFRNGVVTFVVVLAIAAYFIGKHFEK